MLPTFATFSALKCCCKDIIRKKTSGINGPGYIDGRWCNKNDRYCPVWNDKEWKHYLKYTRDEGKCWSPYCNGKSTRLTLHHINYSKKNCDGDNLITLCNSCNSKANTDREWHEAYYTTLMEKKFLRRYDGYQRSSIREKIS